MSNQSENDAVLASLNNYRVTENLEVRGWVFTIPEGVTVVAWINSRAGLSFVAVKRKAKLDEGETMAKAIERTRSAISAAKAEAKKLAAAPRPAAELPKQLAQVVDQMAERG